MAGSNHISRRDFIKLATAAAGTIIVAGVGIPVINYVIDPVLKAGSDEAWIPLGPLENFEVNKPTLVNFTLTKVNGWERTANSFGVFVVRNTGDALTVFSNKCTHLGCRVNWDEAASVYICPCHDGVFAADGSIIRGPQPRALDRYEGESLKVEDGVVMILFKEG